MILICMTLYYNLYATRSHKINIYAFACVRVDAEYHSIVCGNVTAHMRDQIKKRVKKSKYMHPMRWHLYSMYTTIINIEHLLYLRFTAIL